MRSASVTVIINNSAGSDLKENIEKSLKEANLIPKTVIITSSANLSDCEKLVAKAKQTNSSVLAVGGDGTVSTIAAHCHKHGVIMGIIPLGTFNYFAREHGISTTIEEALKIFISGVVKKVAVGFLHNRLFLNNASFGLYTTIIRQRERANSRFGRLRIVATISAISCLFKKRPIFSVDITADGKAQNNQTSMVFVGNNTFQLENLGLGSANCAKQNRLAVVMLKPMTRIQTARLVLRGILRSLSKESQLEEFCADELAVASRRPYLDAVIDGEIIRCPTPLAFRIEEAALQVIVPSENAVTA